MPPGAQVPRLRQSLEQLGAQCQAMADSTEKATATQEERMIDVRRQTMLIMDSLAIPWLRLLKNKHKKSPIHPKSDFCKIL